MPLLKEQSDGQGNQSQDQAAVPRWSGDSGTPRGPRPRARVVARYLFGQSRVDNFAFDVEVLCLAFRNDLDIKKVPVKLEHDGDSTGSLLRDAFPRLISIILFRFAATPAATPCWTSAERLDSGMRGGLLHLRVPARARAIAACERL